MKFKSLFALLCIALVFNACNDKEDVVNQENVFLITLDGLRWQEVFYGIDSSLMNDDNYTESPSSLSDMFWDNDQDRRKQKLMPFFWDIVAKEGQLYGDREEGSLMNATNKFWFSYPGYNEILTGFADDENITSNDKINNQNVTVLEYVNQQEGFQGKVAAFASWDVFPYIINTERNGLLVNAGFDHAEGEGLTDREHFLNQLQDQTPSPWGTVRLDVFTHNFALEYIKKASPRMVYISYGETDDFAHDGDYDNYIKSAHRTDQFINDLWTYIQSSDNYKNNTTLIVTGDHGRGTIPKSAWRSHGSSVDGTDQIWALVIGPKTKSLGLVKGQFYQNQIARTVVEALGIEYNQPKAGAVISKMIK